MSKTLDNNALWNEAARAGMLFGGVSVGCLALKELAGLSQNTFLITAAAVILWAVEFFGCILIMKNVQLGLKDKYEGVRMEHTFRLGRRAALLSGLLLATAQALIIMYMPEDTLDTMMSAVSGSLTSTQKEAVSGIMGKLPLYTFIFQWLYCYLYGTILSSIMSRYIFVKKLFDDASGNMQDNDNTPDEQ